MTKGQKSHQIIMGCGLGKLMKDIVQCWICLSKTERNRQNDIMYNVSYSPLDVWNEGHRNGRSSAVI